MNDSQFTINNQALKSDLLLLLTAIIWGFAFVAQRAGMEYTGPFTFNGIRFALGSLSLVPLLYLKIPGRRRIQSAAVWDRITVSGGLLAGLALFIAASFQQIGIVYTTAGKAGFITGLYVIMVPVLGMFIRQRTKINVWAGAVLAVIGLNLLSIRENFTIDPGDALVLISAIFFAVHILIIGNYSSRAGAVRLSIVQFALCALLSLIAAVFTEEIRWQPILDAAVPIIYGGVFSVGIAYTLQVAGQRHAHPSAASIILSLESLFAVIGGWLILGEYLSARGMAGCALMLFGMIVSQLNLRKAAKLKKTL
ncbi:MAG: DMT family transporter [Bacteroidales bacterium]